MKAGIGVVKILTIHLLTVLKASWALRQVYKASEDLLQDLSEVSKAVTVELVAEELKKKIDEERLKDYLEKTS